MVNKESHPAHVRIWKLPNRKLNFRLIGKNGKTLNSTNQGHNNIGDVKKNLRAVREMFDKEALYKVEIQFHWYASRRAKKLIRIEPVMI